MLPHMTSESPKLDKVTLIAVIFVLLMAAHMALFGDIDVIRRMGHAGALLFSLGILLGLFLPFVFQAKKYALYAVLSFVYEALIVFGAVAAALFPQDEGGWRRSLARYLGKPHPATTAAVILTLGILVWLVKRWRPFGYACLEIAFATASAYYTAQSANPGDPRNFIILGAAAYLVVRGIENAVTAVGKRAPLFKLQRLSDLQKEMPRQ